MFDLGTLFSEQVFLVDVVATGVWFLVSIWLAYRFGCCRPLSPVSKVLTILAFLILGPLYFPFWWLIGAYFTARRDGISYSQALRARWTGPQVEETEEDDSFVLIDSDGKRLFDNYKSERAAAGIRITCELMRHAVEQVASDVLVHPVSDSQFNVRFRVNGTLRNVRELNEEEGKSVVNCIKAISRMDIAERRRPQDGNFQAETPRGRVSFRVATAGILNGEKVSVRVLDQSASVFTLETVGMNQPEVAAIKKAISGSSGMVLICGPTGSGKSSTVHAMLRTIDRVQRNVITIEDPIEYVLPDASQIEINTRAGITFGESLRSVLRQDPDVISVGEIRDAETARIALQAAQTGHLVFATVHSGNNAAAILRLIDLGCDAQLVASALNVVISQRLVRKLCDHCKVRGLFADAEKEDLWKQQIDPNCLYVANGCDHCHTTGFGSRTGVFDIMVLDREMRNRIARGDIDVSTRGHSVGVAEMSTLQVRATQLALGGVTTWEEVQRLSATGE